MEVGGISAAAAIFDVLRGWGVDRVFICPGSTEAAFLDASLANPDIPLVPTTHEAITVSAADAYARLTGRPALAYVHTHLGLANGLAHLSCAALEQSPVVVLNGLKSTALHGNGGFTTTSDVRSLARQWAKWDWQTLRVEAVAEDLNRALRIAASAPAGPTYLAVTQDMLEHDGPVPVPDPAGFRVGARLRPDPEAVRAAAALLAGARRPLIVAGSEVVRGGAWPALVALAERVAAPIFAQDFGTIDAAGAWRTPAGGEWGGRRPVDAAPESPDAVGYAGVFDRRLEAAGEADMIFLAGARTPSQFDASVPPTLPPETPLVHLSADPAEVGRRLPTAAPLVGDPVLGLEDLLSELEARGASGHEDAAAFRERSVAAHREAVERAREEADRDAERVPIPVPSLMRRLTASLEPGTLIVDDSVTGKPRLLVHALAHDAAFRYLTTGGGSLGWGAGAALGAALAQDGTPIVAVVGDGVMQFGLPALWTAVHERLPVTYVVVNNEGYAAVKAALLRFGGEAARRATFPASDLPGPDFAAIARGFGAFGRRVRELRDLEDALSAARAHAGPAVVEVMTDPGDVGVRR